MSSARPVAIVDIGSNSVRLVVYSAATRAPSIIFNEKVMAGLGKGLDTTGRLSRDACDRALAALSRYRLLVDLMGATRTRVFATAAARDASNGAAFLAEVRRLGFEPQVLSGEEEGRLAGLGVASGIPGADGIVGDLGGGSLELVDMAAGEPGRRISLPLGVLRLAAMSAKADAALVRQLARTLQDSGFAAAGKGRDFFLVGGSWRALAKVDLGLIDHPLPVSHQHVLAPERPAELLAAIESLPKDELRRLTGASARVPALAHSAALLFAIVEVLKPRRLVTSAFGIREGLLYDDLAPSIRREDPLIEAARSVGAGLGRFAQHGDMLDAWIAPVFDDPPADARVRLAACLMGDIAWAAHPDFRADRGIDMALHGNWVAIDARGRAMLALALFANFGGSGSFPYPRVAALCSDAEIARARAWGLAIRLGQRLSGGIAAPLEHTSLAVEAGRLVLWLPEDERALYGEAVERRLKNLATAIGKEPDLIVG